MLHDAPTKKHFPCQNGRRLCGPAPQCRGEGSGGGSSYADFAGERPAACDPAEILRRPVAKILLRREVYGEKLANLEGEALARASPEQ